MPKYAIERQYLVPVYQHVLGEAPDLHTACRQAIDNDDWDTSEQDFDNSRATTIAQAVEIPTDFDLDTRSLSECVYNAGLEQLAIPPRFATGDDPIYHVSPEARSLILELREIDAMPDDGPASVSADRRRVVVQALEDLGVTNDLGATMAIDQAQQRPAFDDRELAAVMAGLRLLQQVDGAPSAGFVADAIYDQDCEAIATGGGKFQPLDGAEIDALCERLNRTSS